MTDIMLKNILEHVGGVFFVNPSIVFDNISILKNNGVSFNSDNDACYTVFGLSNLSQRLDNIKNSNHDLNGLNLSQLRDLMIRDNDYCCKNNIVCDKIVNVSSEKEENEGIKRMI